MPLREDLLEEFETAWNHGPPALADFLPAVAADRETWCELVAIDLEHRWRRFG